MGRSITIMLPKQGSPEQLISELEADLDAHREGWVSWDKAQIEHMKALYRARKG